MTFDNDYLPQAEWEVLPDTWPKAPKDERQRVRRRRMERMWRQVFNVRN